MKVSLAFAALLMILASLIPLTGCSCGPEFPGGVTGTVFEDLNANGLRDEGEPGIGKVIVSNGSISRLTNKEGVYNLSAEGSFVFLTVPREYAPTAKWYARLSGEDLDFGLAPASGKDGSDFNFVQLTDIHLDEQRVSDLADVVAEVNTIAPQFVVVTGDLVVEGNGATKEQAEAWFDLYTQTIAGLGSPVFHAIGNHDVVGINRDEGESDLVSGKEIYEANFGPTYYSFDWGEYHCIVLDPHELIEGGQTYRISDQQLGWLKEDLDLRKKSPLLLFFHEPTTAWENRSEVLELLQGYEASFFCGHSHMDVLMDTEGFPEQITGAVCGQWWFGENPDGRPPGYRIVSVSGESLDSLYKWIGAERVLDPGLATPVVSGEVDLNVRVYSQYGVPSEASYRIGDGSPVSMDVTAGGAWSVATATWDTSSLEEGYYMITFQTTDSGGTFEREIEVKVSDSEAVPISEVLAHFDTFQGYYVTVEGLVILDIVGPSPTWGVPAGIGVYDISDAGGTRIMAIAAECKSPPLSKLIGNGDFVRIKTVPVRFTMDFLASAGEFQQFMSMIEPYMSFLPEGVMEKDDTAGEVVAVKGVRLMSGTDLVVTS